MVNLKCPCFLFRYPNLDIPSQALFTLHRESALHLNAVVKTTKTSKALQATQDDPSHGAVTLSSQFGTVFINKMSCILRLFLIALIHFQGSKSECLPRNINTFVATKNTHLHRS